MNWVATDEYHQHVGLWIWQQIYHQILSGCIEWDDVQEQE
jgi:hypothetical protein